MSELMMVLTGLTLWLTAAVGVISWQIVKAIRLTIEECDETNATGYHNLQSDLIALDAKLEAAIARLPKTRSRKRRADGASSGDSAKPSGALQ